MTKVFYLMRNIFMLQERLILKSGRCCSQIAAYSADNASSQNLESASDFGETSLSKEYCERRLPATVEEYKSRKALPLVQPENPYLLKVAVLGEPNVGKSTLINSLVKRKVCAVSRKVHTTRRKSSAVLVEENKQVVFLDTPGFVTPEHTKRHKLDVSFVVDPKRSAESADLVAVVIDASNKWTNKKISPYILQMLENMRNKTSILILNKVDCVKAKDVLLSITRVLTEQTTAKIKERQGKSDEHGSQSQLMDQNKLATEILPSPLKILPDPTTDRVGWPHFAMVFMISALYKDGVDQLREFLLSMAKPAPWMYHSNDITDEHPYSIATQIIREKLLDYLPQEIPYGLSVKVSSWDVDPTGVLKIMVTIGCPNSRHKSFVIGHSGAQIAKCVQSAKAAIGGAFQRQVLLKVEVK